MGAGAATPAVLERLVALSQDKAEGVRSSATSALGRLGAGAATPAVLERLVALIQDKADVVRSSAADALGSLGAAAATAAVLERLAALSQDKDDGVRRSAAWAAGQTMSQLSLDAVDSLAAYWQRNLTGSTYDSFGGEPRDVAQFAFQELQRLAARHAQLMRNRASVSKRTCSKKVQSKKPTYTKVSRKHRSKGGPV